MAAAGTVAFAPSASGPTFDVVSIKKHVAQAGVEVESSKAELDTLIIDRLERPTEN